MPQQVIVTYGSGNAIRYTVRTSKRQPREPIANSQTGKTWRIQPNEVLFNSPSAYRSIYGIKSNAKKGDIYKVWRQNPNVVSTLTEVDKATHGRKKRLLTSAFTDNAIRSAETFIVQHVGRFCDLLSGDEERQTPKNMADLADCLVFDIMCDLAFGKSFDVKESESNPLRSVPHTFDNFTVLMSNVSNFGSQVFYSPKIT